MSTTGLTAPARLDKSYELNGTHLWRWPRLRPRPVGGAVPVVSRSDRAPYERGRLVVTALGAGEFTFEVVQRADRGAPQARIPAFAHVGKIQPFEDRRDRAAGSSGSISSSERRARVPNAAVCPRGQNGDGREVPEALLIAPRLGDRCELAVEPAGAPPELERAWLHVEVENQAAAPGVCP